MPIKLKNNASGFLATAISASDTGLVLQAGNGAAFPTLAATDYFYATLVSTGGTQEVVKVTARVGDTMTVVRAQEGSSAAGFAAGSRLEMRVTAQSVLDVGRYTEIVSVKDFGAKGDGVTDDTAAIQAAINSLAAGIVNIPPGNYLVNSNITILLKGSDSSSQRFAIQATGAKFTGTGGIIIDSCKRLEITGIQMMTQNILMRGCWWSQFNSLQIKQLIINDASATSFDSAYWNQFNNCMFQTIIKSTAGVEAANEFTFNSCTFRGNAAHGYTGTADYAFVFNGNTNAQSWKFFGGDVSYNNIAVYYIDAANTSDVELSFYGVYFDTLLPQLTTRARTLIETHSCHNAIGAGSQNPLTRSFSATTGASTNLFSTGRSFRFNGATHLNLVPGGDMRSNIGVWEGAGKPIGTASGATITVQSGGLNGVYLNINQPATTNNQIFFRTSTLPFTGKMTATLVVRNANSGTKTMRFGAYGLFQDVFISNTEWTFITLTTETPIAAGSPLGGPILYTTDGTAFNVDVAYVGSHYGVSAPLLAASNGFGTIEYLDSTYNPSPILANSVLTQDFTVSGATPGDFILVSTDSFDSNLDNVIISARVSATNTVKLRIYNFTASPIDLPIIGLRFRIWKKDLYV